MKERNGKYIVDGLLCLVLKMVMVTVIVSQKGAGIFDTVMDIIVQAFLDSNYDQELLAVTWNPKG